MLMQTIFTTADLPWPYNLYVDLFCVFMIFVIGVPTIYAMYFGAPWVPTPWVAVRRMIKEANIKKGSIVYELGCGDARISVEAAKLGARVIGFEISPIVYIAGLIRSLLNGGKAKIKYYSFWKESLSDADIVFLYLLPKSMKKLSQKFNKELKKGALIISYAFKMEEMKLVKKIEGDKTKNMCPIWVYRI